MKHVKTAYSALYFVIFILWRSISLLSNFCLILRDLFPIYFTDLGYIGPLHASEIFRLWLILIYNYYLFNGFLMHVFNGVWKVDHAVKYCILGVFCMSIHWRSPTRTRLQTIVYFYFLLSIFNDILFTFYS